MVCFGSFFVYILGRYTFITITNICIFRDELSLWLQ